MPFLIQGTFKTEIDASCNFSYLFNTPRNFANLRCPKMRYYIERESACDFPLCDIPVGGGEKELILEEPKAALMEPGWNL